MEKIKIGTCVPGAQAEECIPQFIKAGFECLSLNFHMRFEEPSLEAYAEKIKSLTAESNVSISSIGFYCNALESKEQLATLKSFIDKAHLFGTSLVTTFAGAIEGDSVDAAIPRYKEVFGELAKRAEDKGVRLAIENCPMDGAWNHTTCNIGFNPRAWEMMFDAVDSKAIGLEWEPAHQMVQLINPLPQLRKWRDRIYHVHGKDVIIYRDRVEEYGVFGATEFAVSRTPGFGDTDWRRVFTALFENGYTGDVCVEGFHDPYYKDELEMVGQKHALEYLNWCRGGSWDCGK